MSRQLRAAGILVPDDSDELVEVIEENLAAIASTRVLVQVVQPTAACQLGCDYCGQAHAPRQMSPIHQGLVVKRVRARLARGRFGALRVSWFGAEPLLGMRTMRHLSPKLAAEAEAVGATYEATVVTNGMLFDEAVATELEHNHGVVEAEITIDGPPSVHDARRPARNGGGSFNRIFKNLCSVARAPGVSMELTMRCNVDGRNADGVDALIDLLVEAELHERVSVYFAPVYSWGNQADRSSLTLEDFAAREIEWLARLASAGFATSLIPSRQEIVCLAVRPDGELIDANGTLFNCTEVALVPSYGEPNRHAVGSLEGGRADAHAPFADFNERILSGAQGPCGACHLLPACGGACPKLWSEGKVPCPSTKLNLGERLLIWYANATIGAEDHMASSLRPHSKGERA
jgi:uncharacterized protein